MPDTSPPRGLLIVIEGLDRSGKTTQCTRLLNSILSTNRPALLQKFPDRSTATGKLINTYLTDSSSSLDDHAIHLLFSANRWEARSKILAALASGTTVVVDRYSFSGAVYSASKGVDGLGVEWAWGMEVGLPRPDLVVFLDLDFEVAETRGGFGEERYEVEGLQRRVRRVFGDVLGRVERVGGGDGVEVRVVDAGVGVDVVEERVWKCYEEALVALKERGREGRGDVGRLGPLRDAKDGEGRS